MNVTFGEKKYEEKFNCLLDENMELYTAIFLQSLMIDDVINSSLISYSVKAP